MQIVELDQACDRLFLVGCQGGKGIVEQAHEQVGIRFVQDVVPVGKRRRLKEVCVLDTGVTGGFVLLVQVAPIVYGEDFSVINGIFVRVGHDPRDPVRLVVPVRDLAFPLRVDFFRGGIAHFPGGEVIQQPKKGAEGQTGAVKSDGADVVLTGAQPLRYFPAKRSIHLRQRCLAVVIT